VNGNSEFFIFLGHHDIRAFQKNNFFRKCTNLVFCCFINTQAVRLGHETGLSIYDDVLIKTHTIPEPCFLNSTVMLWPTIWRQKPLAQITQQLSRVQDSQHTHTMQMLLL